MNPELHRTYLAILLIRTFSLVILPNLKSFPTIPSNLQIQQMINLVNLNQLTQNPISDEALESVPVTSKVVIPSSPLLRQSAHLKKS